MPRIKRQKFSLFIPWLKRVRFQYIAFLFFLANFSCESPKENRFIEKEDRRVVDDFLRYIVISELGAYTILGSKPITHFCIPQAYSIDELKRRYEEMPEAFRRKVSFKKFNRNEQIIKLRETCKKWKNIQHKYIGKHFAIHFNDSMTSGYIVNLPLANYVLREHYQEFSKVLGIEFDPGIVSSRIGDESSSFWKAFEKNGNSFLWGFLFGYGEKNSKFFQWEKEKSIAFPFRIPSYYSPWLKKGSLGRCTFGEKIENLGIPRFIIYQPVDETVEKYHNEKEHIIQIYKKKDFAETTVAFLKGEAIHKLFKKK